LYGFVSLIIFNETLVSNVEMLQLPGIRKPNKHSVIFQPCLKLAQTKVGYFHVLQNLFQP